MTTTSAVEIRFGAPENVLEVQVGTIEVDVPRSTGISVAGWPPPAWA